MIKLQSFASTTILLQSFAKLCYKKNCTSLQSVAFLLIALLCKQLQSFAMICISFD